MSTEIDKHCEIGHRKLLMSSIETENQLSYCGSTREKAIRWEKLIVSALFSCGTTLELLINQLLDFHIELILEWTCLTSPSVPLIFYPNGSPCLVLKPYIDFCDHKRVACGTSIQQVHDIVQQNVYQPGVKLLLTDLCMMSHSQLEIQKSLCIFEAGGRYTQF